MGKALKTGNLKLYGTGLCNALHGLGPFPFLGNPVRDQGKTCNAPWCSSVLFFQVCPASGHPAQWATIFGQLVPKQPERRCLAMGPPLVDNAGWACPVPPAHRHWMAAPCVITLTETATFFIIEFSDHPAPLMIFFLNYCYTRYLSQL